MPTEPLDPLHAHKRFASSAAAQIAADMLSAGLSAPGQEVVGVAVLEEAGLRIFVSLTAYLGPARLFLHPSANPSAFPPGAVPAPVPAPLHVLSEIQRCIMEAATTQPMKMTRLANLAGYYPGSYFRSNVNWLVELGLLVRVSGGVRRK